jgi:HK97 family phage portal protein
LENPSVSLSDPSAWEDLGWSESSDAGESVTAARALTCPAIWQAVGMISGDVSKLPLEIYQRGSEGRREATDHPAWLLISQAYGRANRELSALVFWRRFLLHGLIWPRGWAWIERDPAGRPVGLYNLLPDRTWYASVADRLWVVSEIGGRLEAFDPDDVLAIENIAIDDADAFGPLKAARHNIGLQLAQRKFNSRFYSSGCHAGGILQVPPGASDKATAKIQESIEKHRSGADQSFRALVLRDGFKWHQTTVSPDDAQAGETAEAEVRNVARFYRMAPSRLGVSESISYNSEEAARRAYHDETLSYWLAAIKSECNLKLLTEQQRVKRTHYCDYNVAALLWADTQTVMTVGAQGVQWGIFSRDEVRGWFNLNPIPGGAGETFLQPLNMTTAGESGDNAGGNDASDSTSGAS